MFHHHRHHGCPAGDDERRFARGEFRREWGERMRGFRHFRGGHGRPFDQGDLRFVILQLIAEKPRYGYELIKAIEEKLGGAYSPSPGVVYPTLTMLEELGYATVSSSEGGKKLYAITPDGTAFLDANRETVAGIFQRMEKIGAAQGGGPAPQILRAMENLRLALRLRLVRGPLSEEQVRAIAETLDAAAVKIEQS
jgi:DNA-binding PadR family transcriptional regulator